MSNYALHLLHLLIPMWCPCSHLPTAFQVGIADQSPASTKNEFEGFLLDELNHICPKLGAN